MIKISPWFVLFAVVSAAAFAAELPPDLGQRLDAVAAAAVPEGFAGVVVVETADGKELLARGYGVANVATGARFTPDTLVQIGSNVKDFTKVAIFQLAEAGKLSLADPISRYFPDVPADKQGISIDQLLEHTSGLPIGLDADRKLVSKEDFLRRLWAAKLEFPPGSGERYSNAGYSVLAAIVEKITGESYDDYVDRAILRPLGLREIGYLKPGFDPARLAHGYDGGVDQGTMLDLPHYPDGHGWSMRGNGGYVATARDEIRFFRAIAAGKLLADPAHRDRVFSPDGPVVLGGSDNVCYFLFAAYPGPGVWMVVASNRAEFPGTTLLKRFEAILGVGGPRRTSHALEAPAKPVVLPDTPAGHLASAWLAAYATGDDAVMTRFYAEHAVAGDDAPPIEKRLESFHRMRRNLGELTPVAFAESADGLVLTVQTGRGERADLTFVVGADGRLRGIQVMVG